MKIRGVITRSQFLAGSQKPATHQRTLITTAEKALTNQNRSKKRGKKEPEGSAGTLETRSRQGRIKM